MGYPGFAGLKLTPGGPSLKHMGYTPAGYSTTGGSESFHFPDGNASIARLLVRALVPNALLGGNARDVVTAKADYSKLDQPGEYRRYPAEQPCSACNAVDGVEVAFTASRGGGKIYIACARGTACWPTETP